jgi:hypothetical protein
MSLSLTGIDEVIRRGRCQVCGNGGGRAHATPGDLLCLSCELRMAVAIMILQARRWLKLLKQL